MYFRFEIQFTLDTICPWTYLARRRLMQALDIVRERNDRVAFIIKYMPFELYPASTQEGEDKYDWYRKSKYGDSEEKMATYMTLMTAYGLAAEPPIHYKFGGTVANTLQAHRVIQHFQAEEGKKPANGMTERLVSSLYRQYFEEERHPSSPDTLLAACCDAGINEAKARAFIEDEQDGLMDVKMLIREQKSNGIDSVPHVRIEGRKRDITLEGCKEVEEYVKALEQIAKEAS